MFYSYTEKTTTTTTNSNIGSSGCVGNGEGFVHSLRCKWYRKAYFPNGLPMNKFLEFLKLMFDSENDNFHSYIFKNPSCLIVVDQVTKQRMRIEIFDIFK